MENQTEIKPHRETTKQDSIDTKTEQANKLLYPKAGERSFSSLFSLIKYRFLFYV